MFLSTETILKSCFLVLKLVKESQSQHGLKHGDYQRYRAYCARRIKRLRKSISFVQSTGNRNKSVFQMKKVTNQMVVDASSNKKDPLRYLLSILFSAERCWAFAMALKQEANTEHRKKFHLIRRLKKAVVFSRVLQNLCNREPNKCDGRTKLETQAYHCYLSGILYFETESWRKASNYLRKAQAIYTKLCEVIGDEEESAIYHHRIDELKPTFRFCAFNLGEELDGNKDFLTSLNTDSVGDDYMSSKLEQLILQTREKQAMTLSEVSWLGKTLAVKHEKIRSFLLLVQEANQIKGEKLDRLEKLSFECRDSLQILREAGQEKSPLFAYLLYLRHDLTIQRNLGVISTLAHNSERIRPYEVIIESLEEFKTLNLQQYFNGNEVNLFLEKIEHEAIFYKAFRCYFIGKSGKLNCNESLAFLRRATGYAKTVIDSPHIEPEMKYDLKRLVNSAESEEYIIYANSLIEDQELDQEARDRVSISFLFHYSF